jgi:GNAT superfamily N-acetyltransferase
VSAPGIIFQRLDGRQAAAHADELQALHAELTTPLPADVTAEHPGRTFALTELLVRASWRRQGIGAALHDLILAGRPEERATAVVRPAAGAAQNAFRSWGWRKVARTSEAGPGASVSDVLVTTLRR